ncbi:MAG: transcription termination factor Rho [Planctomycetota bacterium]|nr:transcription termination factor Rho [Planctomycetota bacterium]
MRRGDLHISELDELSDEDVEALARHAGVKPREGERRSETLYRLVNEGSSGGGEPKELIVVEGLLELHPDSYGFLRLPKRNYTQHPDDVYVAAGMVRRLGLKPGHWITGKAHRRRPNQPQLALHSIDEVNHEAPERVKDLTDFDKLTVIYPDQRLHLETTADDVEMRVMDLFCPLGRGQRGLIVAPPRTGKTIMLTKLADAIATNSPDVDIVVLLVDERPEEVTNMRRSVRGEVIASTFDKPASNHIRVAELVMEKVKRMVEFGRHVVLLLDSITRMGRAYNNATGGSGRILTGGLDAKALTKPKRFFGSARNVEDGGSLTIVATALVDTGSRMDEVIFEEFKGTGNMELVLSRDMANARVWPAIDVPKSATRNEDLLMHPDELRRVTLLRRGITGQDPQAVMLALRDKMRVCSSNAEFLMQLGN